MTEKEKSLRKWFQRHGWHTNSTPTGSGFYMESPICSGAGSIHYAINPQTGNKEEYSSESFVGIELDRYECKYVSINCYKRKQWWKKDNTVPNNGFWYSTVPSDEFSEWEDAGYTCIPAEDILKIAEMITESQKEYCRIRKKKYSPGMFSAAKEKCARWIKRNTSYDSIKWDYSNKRLMQERNCDDPFSWKP